MVAETEYRRVRARALAEIARSVVRDPPRGDDEGAGGPDDGERSASDEAVSFAPAVRAWLEANFEEAFDDVGGVEAAVETDLGPVDASGVDALQGEAGDVERERLHAYRAVRMDLLAGLDEYADDLATAVEVHDALERLVGERGPPADRRPRDVVASFEEWVADGRVPGTDGGETGLTVLHVMRIASLDPLGGNAPEGLLETVGEWLSEVHPGALDPGSASAVR